MQFRKLRLVGFKSFVEQTEFEIQPGLTGVVGPNGCGKSNLIEAMRWVMGESSYKSMRASGMDDVIFAGGGDRPARNHAEVQLTLDNAARMAPAAFNDSDTLEITRRIERERGSTYRINGREVRARDVQILFADASTGARSPALVRQGQISEIISAKPQARRRILEEAAGVAGLHTRRHEAELRLKGAEENLARIDDVLTQISSQGDSLRRQARHAQRFREYQADIRRLQALAVLLEWEAAERELAEAEGELATATRRVLDSTRVQGETARLQAIAAHAMPNLREHEAKANITVQNALVARQALDGEERRAKARKSELDRRLTYMRADLARDRAVLDDAAKTLERLRVEERDLGLADEDAAIDENLQLKAVELGARRAAAESLFGELTGAKAEADARRLALDERLRQDAALLLRRERELTSALQAHEHAGANLDLRDALAASSAQLDEALARAASADAAARNAAGGVELARAVETASRGPLADADRILQRVETELKTLTKLLAAAPEARWARVADTLVVSRGCEVALGAALGEDLEASDDPQAPAYWVETSTVGDPSLPEGAAALSDHVNGVPALRRRLGQIGLVDRASGPALRAQLAPGQCLVSREGDVWRWDGLTQAAEAPSTSARRFAERNRLADLRVEAEAARETFKACKVAADIAGTELRHAIGRDAARRAAAQDARHAADAARTEFARLERRHGERAGRLAALEAAVNANRTARDEAAAQRAEIEAAAAALPDTAGVASRLSVASGEVATWRAAEADARAALQARTRERDARARRLAAIGAEQASWQARAEAAEAHGIDLAQRLCAAEREYQELLDAPDRFILARRQILSAIEVAETASRAAADARAAGEAALAEADRHARAALGALASSREAKVRGEAHVEAAVQRREDLRRKVAVELECDPQALAALAGLAPDVMRPPAAEVTARLDLLKEERDRLGAVNLRADEELAAVEGQRSDLDREKADLVEAIRRLRQAIGTLNNEGRERLLAAFDRVNAHFQGLFATLFGGGTAELQLIESDDPLEAGLEILARPPGKKPQVMTLLSGGEQALTAISLIFAVFLTNPSPICVLDEVDAPLDDANVERLCDLLDDVRSKTQTRFIAITHNPISMARMDRLYGVTQAERGVSQLVSVDLSDAEEMSVAS